MSLRPQKPNPNDPNTWHRDPRGPAGTHLSYADSLAAYERAMGEINANPRERGEFLVSNGVRYTPKPGQTLAEFESLFKAGRFNQLDMLPTDAEFVDRVGHASEVSAQRKAAQASK